MGGRIIRMIFWGFSFKRPVHSQFLRILKLEKACNVQNLINAGCLLRAEGDKKALKLISVPLRQLERLEYKDCNTA